MPTARVNFLMENFPVEILFRQHEFIKCEKTGNIFFNYFNREVIF